MNIKNILIIAKDYPPSSVSSGVQRILKFSQYLPELGWSVQVLTMHPKAYGNAVSSGQLAEIPSTVLVKRAFALNTALHLSYKGSYFGWMAWPDRWVTWVPFGLVASLNMIRRNRPTLLFSTYPCASAHLLALLLHKVSGIPWIADFRDPMLYKNDNVTGMQRRIYDWIERHTLIHCRHAIFTTPGAIEHYAKVQYPHYPANKWVLIANGFDEQNFVEISRTHEPVKSIHKPLVLLHAGYLYRAERDPSYFFRGVAQLFQKKILQVGDVKIILRASGFENEYGDLISTYGLQEVIFLESAVPYKQALAEMMSVDGLLLFQGALCNHQIPAKAYEYFRAKKPVFALTDPLGDTAALLNDAGVYTIAPLDDETQIAHEFLAFINLLKTGKAPIADNLFVAKQSRQSRTAQLADLLESVSLDR